MQRQNWRSCSLSGEGDFGGWESNQPASQQIYPNIYTYLSNNIYTYDFAYKKENHRQSSTNYPQIRQQRRNTSCYSGKIKPLTTDISLNQHKEKPVRTKKMSQLYDPFQDDAVINNTENININFIPIEKKRRQNHSQGTAGCSISIKNVKFNISATGCIKKKDKYRQIFGERPKYLFVKLQNGETVKKGTKMENSLNHFRVR